MTFAHTASADMTLANFDSVNSDAAGIKSAAGNPADKTLSEMPASSRCRIINADACAAELQSRLYALGLYPGVTVEVLRFAPVGDPIQIRVGSTLLSIRKQEASLIAVEKI